MEQRYKLFRITGGKYVSLFDRTSGRIEYSVGQVAKAFLGKFGYYPLVFDSIENAIVWINRMGFSSRDPVVLSICEVEDKCELPPYVEDYMDGLDFRIPRLEELYASPKVTGYTWPEGTEMWKSVTPVRIFTSTEMDNFWTRARLEEYKTR